MKQLNNNNAQIGSIVGTYDPGSRSVYWSYIIIGGLEGSHISLLNFRNGKVVKYPRHDLYVPDKPRNGQYLDFDQESMGKGDLVRFKNSNFKFTITKVHPVEMSCDLTSDIIDFPIKNVPLAYLKYVNKEDSIRAQEGLSDTKESMVHKVKE